MPEARFRTTVAEDLDLIRAAAREAGDIAMRYFKQRPEVWLKGGHSPVSEADYAVDRFLRETLLAARPDYGWLSEETADTPARLSSARVFVVDPIDGTRGFLEGRSSWCVSVAIVEEGLALCGVLDCPAKKQVFHASIDGGAWLDGSAIRIGEPKTPPRIAGPKQFVTTGLRDTVGEVASVPYIPSLAYRIAIVAKGEIDATFVKPNSHDWDLAAADIILREAGGKVVGLDGVQVRYATTANPRHGALVAGSGPLLDTLVGAAADLGA